MTFSNVKMKCVVITFFCCCLYYIKISIISILRLVLSDIYTDTVSRTSYTHIEKVFTSV